MIGKRFSDRLRNPRKLAHRESEAAGRMVRKPDIQRSPPPDQIEELVRIVGESPACDPRPRFGVRPRPLKSSRSITLIRD
jgi:hypothetical protein